MAADRRTLSPRESASLTFLYENPLGRILLKLLTRPAVSRVCGRFMDSGLSKGMIKGFAEKNGISPERYEEREYTCFNDFFCRRLKGFSFDRQPGSLISPCDAKLSVFPVDSRREFFIKGVPYKVSDLLQDEGLAARYEGGLCLIFRLTVDDYHRYCYMDSGVEGKSRFLPGKLHTVQPIALRSCNIYRENCREYTVLETEHFGTAVQVEVGALLVGKIVNYHGAGCFAKGEEKGMFRYGGSTIVLLLEEDRVRLDPEFIENTRRSLETVVKIGEKIGTAAGKRKKN